MYLLYKLTGDYTSICSRRPSADTPAGSSHGSAGADKDKSEDSDIQAGRLSVYIHKRDDQLSHEVIQPLLRYHRTIL